MGLNSLTQCGHKCYLFSRPWKREGALPVTDVLKQRFHKKTGYFAVLQVLKGVWLASTPFQEAARGCDLQIKPSKETRLSVLRRLFKTLLPAVFSVGRKEAGPGSPCDSLAGWEQVSWGAGILRVLVLLLQQQLWGWGVCDYQLRS